MNIHTFTAIIEKRKDWFIGYVEELPGVNSQGKTIEEVRDNLKEALELVIQANRDIAEQDLKDREYVREEITVSV